MNRDEGHYFLSHAFDEILMKNNFLTKLDKYQDYSKTLQSAKEKLKNNIRFACLENRGETSFFMSRHFDQTMTILILHFSVLVH